MLSFLVRLLILLVILWLIRRFVAQLLAGGARRQVNPTSSAGTTGSANRMVKDPVCGMYLDPRLAVALNTRQGTIYFCSDECSAKFRRR